jgi:hypothetical protein
MELTQLRLELPVPLLLNLILKNVDPRENFNNLDILKAFSE